MWRKMVSSCRSMFALVLLIVAGLLQLPSANAENITVGDGTIGWAFPPSRNLTYYTEWASMRTFKVGDNLQFNYNSSDHNVFEVSEENAKACVITQPLKKYLNSSVLVPLTTAGNISFVCGFPGHCINGMVMTIRVQATGSTATPPPALPSPSTPPPPSAPPPPPPSDASVLQSRAALVCGAMLSAFAAALL